MPCASCTDEARCDRAGLCQTFARQQLQREEKTETVTWRPATATNLPDADETVLIACDTQFHSEPVWLGFHDGKGWREAGGEPAFVTHWARMLAGPHGVPGMDERQQFEAFDRKQFDIDAELHASRFPDGRYTDRPIQCRWETWQAARGVLGTQGGQSNG